MQELLIIYRLRNNGSTHVFTVSLYHLKESILDQNTWNVIDLNTSLLAYGSLKTEIEDESYEFSNIRKPVE